MNKSFFPVYEDFIGGIPKFPIQGDVSRFHIDIRWAKYFHLHHHHYAELSYYLDEDGVESINGVNHDLKPGTVSFLLPHHMHLITGNPECRNRKICCMFEMGFLANHMESNWFSRQLYGVGTSISSFADFPDNEDERIKQAFLHLLEEYKKPESPSRLAMIHTKLKEVLLLFLREASSQPCADPDLTVKNEGTNHLWPLLKYINSHYMNPLTLKELSKQFHLTEPYISRIFKEHVKMGFIEYLHRLRVERAVSMLLHTEMSITELALEVGFESTRTFSRVFRDIKGVSAKEYRFSLKS